MIARQGNTTSLTLVNDYGDAEGSFGYVMPVPAGISLDNVATVDPAVIERLDAYSAPRVVEYTCDDVGWYWEPAGAGETGGHWAGSADGSGGGCGGGAAGHDFEQNSDSGSDENVATTDGLDGSGAFESVAVTARTTLGAYELALVEASGAHGLQDWLDGEGFTVASTTASRLQTYIDQGQSFLVARVDLDTLPTERNWLPPLRIQYTSDAISLPIWLGAASSSGQQDLLIFGVTQVESGALAISNYADHTIVDECLVDDSSAYLQTEWDALTEADTTAPWVSEFGWLSGKCDPCANDALLTDDDVAAVGFSGLAQDAFFTRLHLRYRPDQITEDVMLYESGVVDRWQTRFMKHTAEIEDFLPLCEGTEAIGGETCEAPEGNPYAATEEAADDAKSSSQSGGSCCSGSSAAFLLFGMGWATRRRERV